MPTSTCQPISLLDSGCWYKFSYWMTNSLDPFQLASDLEIYCLPRHSISGLTTFYFKFLTPTAVKVWLIIYNDILDVLTHVTDQYIDSSVSKKHLVCCVKYKLATKIPNRNFCIVLWVISVYSICYHFLK